MQTRVPEWAAEQMSAAPLLDKYLAEIEVRRGAAVQASLTLLAQFTTGDSLASDVLEIARYINTGEVA